MNNTENLLFHLENKKSRAQEAMDFNRGVYFTLLEVISDIKEFAKQEKLEKENEKAQKKKEKK